MDLAIEQLLHRAVVVHQRWEETLFVHWRAPADEVARDLPAGVDVETHDGTAWLSLVASCVRARPALVPEEYALEFVELRLRTYVTSGNLRATWLFGTDVTSPIARAVYRVLLGRTARHADIACVRAGEALVYGARRGHASLSLRADGNDPLALAPPPGLTSYLLERDVQLTRRLGVLWALKLHHDRLRPAAVRVDVSADDWLRTRRVLRPGAPMFAHTVQDVDVDVLAPWPLARARLRAAVPARLAG